MKRNLYKVTTTKGRYYVIANTQTTAALEVSEQSGDGDAYTFNVEYLGEALVQEE